MPHGSDNVKLVQDGFAAIDAGDFATVMEQWHPEVVYCGFGADGEVNLARGG